MFNGIRVLCSPGFFDALTGHAAVKDAFARWNSGEFLRTDYHNSGFPFAGMFFEEYSGNVAGVPFIPADKAYMVPLGVPDMFMTLYAPADYMDTVNTIGLPYYAKQERMGFDKGVEVESQSNPIHINTRPDAVIELSA